ncbi:hypothetical protein KFZ70_01175 [Tamlana fucoidanivorans]|uniref:Carboxypeptidase-like regulatory domain-containing protein n=1 Tax=Allotamlana fucoidanivorans TaxID=2583814 RepID=A0A5C4SL13_9FLAO|nr:hypothetical protein [Tamlana fucoidanivorans]TNJ44624.1 hypothetical protein FGF67_08240 [Tamlana fucoidanivorans]
MKRLLSIFIFGCLFWFSTHSQSVILSGKVESTSNVENIHVINKTAQVFTITNTIGVFEISVKVNDTIQFSSVQHKDKELVMTPKMILSKTVKVHLEEQVNALDEVVVGKVLSGNLTQDIKTTEGKAPINFYDVGIPGYQGKIATIGERRLHEATTGGGIVPLNPIINAITGRTKRLKNQVKMERKETLMQRVKARWSDEFFTSYPLEPDLRMDFFYFCMDDENFMDSCQNKSDLIIFTFLKMKYIQYQKNRTALQD